jgi:hypothetical protein
MPRARPARAPRAAWVTMTIVMTCAIASLARGAHVRRDLRAIAVGYVQRAQDDATIDLSPGVELGAEASVANGRVGIVARDGLDAMDAYARVSWGAVLHPPTTYDAGAPGLGATLAQLKLEHGADDKTALIVSLLYEKYELGERSKFYEYLRAMPEEFDTPTFWSEANTKELEGSDSYEHDVIEEYKTVRNVWIALQQRVFDAYPEVFTNSAAKSWHALRWAWTVAHARAIRVRGKEGLAIVPVIDMIHECAGNETAADASEHGEDMGYVVYDHHSDTAVVYAKREYAPGEAVCERFGRMSNFDSIQHLGYLPDIDEGDSRNCVLFVMQAPDKYAEKVKNAGFETPWRACVAANAKASSLDLLASFVELADGREIVVNATGVPVDVRKNALRDLIKARIDRYPTSLEVDEASLDAMRATVRDYNERINAKDLDVLERAQMELRLDDARRGALAVEFRMREKKVLAALYARIETLLLMTSATEERDEL